MYLAAGVFNEDHSFILRIMSMLNIIIGRQSKSYDDKSSATSSPTGASQLMETKEARKTCREQLLTENEFYEERPWSWNRRLTSKSMKSYR